MPSNSERADRARTIVADHYDFRKTFAEDVVDLLTDIRHMCFEEDIDITDCLRLSELHFSVEISEEA